MRSGISNDGEMYVARYNASQSKWISSRFISSSSGNYRGSRSRGPYTAGGMKVDDDGKLHVAWLWREASNCYNGSNTDFDCNHGLNYAFSDDEGLSWKQNNGATIANTNRGQSISIANTGTRVADIPQSLRPQNTAISSIHDGVQNEMHVMIKHKPSPDRSPATHHYVRDARGQWRVNISSFNVSNVDLTFQGNKLFAVAGRSGAALYFADRSDDYKNWTQIQLPSLPGPRNRISGGYTTWDTSMISEGILIATWHQPGVGGDGKPSPIEVYTFRIGDVTR